MRIVIDMQGAQSRGNWNRGIGRYTMSLALAMVRNRGSHDVLLALNGHFPESIERIRAKFTGILPQENICVWYAASPMAYIAAENTWRRQSGELVREAFITSLRPDIVLLSSLFEGLIDDTATSIKRFTDQCITAVILYDLIPFIHHRSYLKNPSLEAWYLEKIEYLRHADLYLAISESSRQEGIKYLDLPLERCVNILTDADNQFQTFSVPTEVEHRLRQQYGLMRSFVMYTGGIDHRKNVEGLIQAYAKLSPQLRSTHQLAIVCAVQDDSRHRLLTLATAEGLAADEVILTGFIPEEHLVTLYNLCTVFVFPSWHEGFGLPALEAMRCGAPVIASNNSSLPEVIGLEEALFDPHSADAIACAIEQVLVDTAFRERLIAHGKEQVKQFSWDESARRAITAMERTVTERKAMQSPKRLTLLDRPRLAYVSPLPPERSGISDYSAELLPVLAQHYEIEVVVAQEYVTDPWITENCPIRSVSWLVENSERFDRVLYHFGNSEFHQHMFGLLKKIPGVVVLHDFYLSGVLFHMDALGYTSGYFIEQLYKSHGYFGLVDYCRAKDVTNIIWKYPCSRSVLEGSIGTIFHSENSIRLAKYWYGNNGDNSSIIPLIRSVAITTDDVLTTRTALGFTQNDFIVCSFGMLGPSKLNLQLLTSWFESDLAKTGECHLVFVGENHAGDYGDKLLSLIKQHPYGNSVSITGWVDQQVFRQYLSVADLGVQLRTLSRGETSAAVLDCMNYGLATIVNANGSMADLDADAVWKLADEFDDQALIHALETLWRDHARRKTIGAKAKALIIEKHDPIRCAEQYKTAIEGFYTKNRSVLNDLLGTIATITSESISDTDLVSLARAIAISFPPLDKARQLFVDVSELVQCDARTGIQRVVRSVLKEWLENPPDGFRVEPVYATQGGAYRYARQFTANFLDLSNVTLSDDLIDYRSGDIFFALDLQPQVQVENTVFYQQLRSVGVTVKFMVYDLLCITQREHFVQGAADVFTNWLQVVGENDGVVCISQAVATELRDWMQSKPWQRLRPFAIDVVHLGADVGNSVPTQGLPIDGKEVLTQLIQHPCFLMVGTLEPRKGHAQVLDAFESLWRNGTDVNLVIVGKQGWMVEPLVKRLRTHPEREKRLFWLEGISDEYLEKVYAASTCLIAASYGEGFGLPLIEAAQHKLPIFARDIPVFREVAGEHASYFSAQTAEALAQAIQVWLSQYQLNQHPKSNDMPWLTWKESARMLLERLSVAKNSGLSPKFRLPT